MFKYLLIILMFLPACTPGIILPADNQLTPAQTQKEDILKIVVFDVGQGDVIFLSTPIGTNVLIDGGPKDAGRDIILPFLAEHGINQIDYMYVSHYHDDHIGGLDEIIRGWDGILNTSDDLVPLAIFDRGLNYDSSSFDEYKNTAYDLRNTIKAGDMLQLDSNILISAMLVDGQFTDGNFIDPENDENSAGIALLITYNDIEFLTSGDLTGSGTTIEEQPADLESYLGELVGNIDILKVSHHGSKLSTTNNFIESTSPEMALISCGENDYMHPAAEVINRLLNKDVEIHITEQCSLPGSYTNKVNIANGNIIIKSNGYDFWVEDSFR